MTYSGGFSDEYLEEIEKDSGLLEALGITAATGGLAAGGYSVARGKQYQKATGQTFGDAYKDAAKDTLTDLHSALEIVTGKTAYDQQQQNIDTGRRRDTKNPIKQEQATLRKFAEGVANDGRSRSSFASTADPGPGSPVRNPISQMAIAARDAFNPGAEDFLATKRDIRLQQGKSPEGPKSDTVWSRVPLIDAYRDLVTDVTLPGGRTLPGAFGADEVQKRKAHGIDLMKGNAAQTLGSAVGRTSSDFINNGVRSMWWLLNAPQAVVDVASEAVAGRANREGLYGLDYELRDEAIRRGWVKDEGGGIYEPAHTSVNPVNFNFSKPTSQDPELQRRVSQLQKRSGDLRTKDQRLYSRRRTGNNLSTLLALPSAILINQGLGLVSPYGGNEGRKAVFPDEEDPTKTSNVLAEVAAKYILGRQGDILPWSEYKKVRPDVSKDDYMRYKAYRFDKREDWNPSGGDLNILTGILKGDDDGIDGPEIMFLGRSMPVATTLMPTAAAMGGAGLGAAMAKYGALNTQGIEEGIERRNTHLQTLGRKLAASEAELRGAKTDELKSKAQKDIDRYTSEQSGINRLNDRKAKQLDFMKTGPMKGMFGSLRNRRVTQLGLAGGSLGAAAGILLGGEIERRRREGKIAENSQLGFS